MPAARCRPAAPGAGAAQARSSARREGAYGALSPRRRQLLELGREAHGVRLCFLLPFRASSREMVLVEPSGGWSLRGAGVRECVRAPQTAAGAARGGPRLPRRK